VIIVIHHASDIEGHGTIFGKFTRIVQQVVQDLPHTHVIGVHHLDGRVDIQDKIIVSFLRKYAHAGQLLLLQAHAPKIARCGFPSVRLRFSTDRADR